MSRDDFHLPQNLMNVAVLKTLLYMASRPRSLLLLLLLTASALSQTPAPLPSHAITGTVHDPSNAAIVGARVSIIGVDGNAIAQTITDNSGAFHFDKLSPGNYQLDVQ